MLTINADQAVQWIRETGIHGSINREEHHWPTGEKRTTVEKEISFGTTEAYRLRIPLLSVEYYRFTNLANLLLPYRDQILERCLLWFTDWGMWNADHERVAHKLVSLFRAVHGESKPLIESPAHLFDPSEAVEAQTLLTTAMWVSWDVYVIPQHGQYFVHNSNDEFLDVVSRDRDIHEERLHCLKDWGAREISGSRAE